MKPWEFESGYGREEQELGSLLVELDRIDIFGGKEDICAIVFL